MGNITAEAAQQYAEERAVHPPEEVHMVAHRTHASRITKVKIVCGVVCWGAIIDLGFPAREAAFDVPKGFFVKRRDTVLILEPLHATLVYTSRRLVVEAAEGVAASCTQTMPQRLACQWAAAMGEHGSQSAALARDVLFAPHPTGIVLSADVPDSCAVIAAAPSFGDRMAETLRVLKQVPDKDVQPVLAWARANALALFGLSPVDVRRMDAVFAATPADLVSP